MSHRKYMEKVFSGVDEKIVANFQQDFKDNLIETKFQLNTKFLPYFPSRIIMPDVAFIVARTDQNVIGCENKLPWRMRSDMARFRDLTSHHPVIMGRKTYESIGKPLPKRFNIVISRDKSFKPDGVTVFSSTRDALLFADVMSIITSCEKIFVVGGSEIFSLFERAMSLLFLTQIHDKGKILGDAFFSYKIDLRSWAELYKKEFHNSIEDDYPSTFLIFRKKKTSQRSRASASVHAGIISNEAEIENMAEKYDLDRRRNVDARQFEFSF